MNKCAPTVLNNGEVVTSYESLRVIRYFVTTYLAQAPQVYLDRLRELECRGKGPVHALKKTLGICARCAEAERYRDENEAFAMKVGKMYMHAKWGFTNLSSLPDLPENCVFVEEGLVGELTKRCEKVGFTPSFTERYGVLVANRGENGWAASDLRDYDSAVEYAKKIASGK